MPTEILKDGKKIARHAAKEVERLPSQSDWPRVDAMTDEELTANALSDADNQPLDDAFFERAKRVRLEDFMPATKEKVCLRLDRDVVAWFRARKKKGYQTAINAALRAFIASQSAGRER
ncbi:BrnA antitoxin family protein [Desulfolutivibrio sulfoxidireducens]|uniref:BrnA antitoxin family protein n=1 Tax=Desulfolutivibrio sulfoxidireducens TaxID=2773299 RepID=UPI00159EA82E|nr:BrnA antitoxin family protein [Desulfolutivibrio sulfoxidireducens]QLA17213.1 hypothetical protein GD605_14505 [Desulfolutivibrio sulfoxidireducens]QLA20782.1 hypothetical protein GD604_14195 [Desulfolutivibrio sulfoxidireducens]